MRLKIRLQINSKYQEDGLSASQRIVRDLVNRKIPAEVIAKKIRAKRQMVTDLMTGVAINPNVDVLNRLLKFYMEISKHSDMTKNASQIPNNLGG